MEKTERFIGASGLLVCLTILSLSTSRAPYVMVLLCGVLMVVYNIRSFAEETDKVTLGAGALLFGQAVLSTAFALVSEHFMAFLIFYECFQKRRMRILVPPVFCVLVQVFCSYEKMPFLFLHALILLLVTTLTTSVEHLILWIVMIKTQREKAVCVNALGELHEKKQNHELTRKNYLVEKNARLKERETISRNIHNSVGHSITAAVMALDAADMLFVPSPERAREKMNLANERIRGSLQAVRHAVRVLDEENICISLGDLLAALAEIAEDFTIDTAIHVTTDFPHEDTDRMLPREHTEFLTGAAKEFLTNGVRHGGADTFLLQVIADSRHIMLRVLDNGKSDFCTENSEARVEGGFGLKKMVAYTKQCGGTAEFENRNGFVSTITLPLYENNDTT